MGILLLEDEFAVVLKRLADPQTMPALRFPSKADQQQKIEPDEDSLSPSPSSITRDITNPSLSIFQASI